MKLLAIIILVVAITCAGAAHHPRSHRPLAAALRSHTHGPAAKDPRSPHPVANLPRASHTAVKHNRPHHPAVKHTRPRSHAVRTRNPRAIRSSYPIKNTDSLVKRRPWGSGTSIVGPKKHWACDGTIYKKMYLTSTMECAAKEVENGGKLDMLKRLPTCNLKKLDQSGRTSFLFPSSRLPCPPRALQSHWGLHSGLQQRCAVSTINRGPASIIWASWGFLTVQKAHGSYTHWIPLPLRPSFDT